MPLPSDAGRRRVIQPAGGRTSVKGKARDNLYDRCMHVARTHDRIAPAMSWKVVGLLRPCRLTASCGSSAAVDVQKDLEKPYCVVHGSSEYGEGVKLVVQEKVG